MYSKPEIKGELDTLLLLPLKPLISVGKENKQAERCCILERICCVVLG